MKVKFIITALLFCFLNLFSKQPIIKIFVIDQIDRKFIKNAKVTLEGFDLKEIVAKFDKENHYYYFEEIPLNYNTVMVYSKNYNEHGYQNLSGLPKELTITMKKKNLQNYNFKYDTDYYRDYIENTDNYVDRSCTFQKFFIEDPYKIAIRSNDYNFTRIMLPRFIKENNLDVEIINPYWEIYKKMKMPMNQKEPYPFFDFDEFPKTENKNDFIDAVVPFYYGSSNLDFIARIDYSYDDASTNDIVFFIRKKDGSTFKRFNDPNIKKLRELFFVMCVVYCKGYYQPSSYDKKNKITWNNPYKSFSLIEERVEKFNKKYKIDKSRDFFYNYELGNEEYDKDYRQKDFSNEHNSKFNLVYELLDWEKTTIVMDIYHNSYSSIFSKIPKHDSSIGLGILDLFDDSYNQIETK